MKRISSIKKRVLLRKRRIDSTFIGDLIFFADRWYVVETEIVLNMYRKKCIKVTCFMAGMEGRDLKVGAVTKMLADTKVIVLKNKYPLWRRMIYRLYR